MRRVQLHDEVDNQCRLGENLIDVAVLVAEDGNESTRVELEEPCWARVVEIDTDLVIGEIEFLEDDVDAVAPATSWRALWLVC